jgi:Rad3-related DNA helicase
MSILDFFSHPTSSPRATQVTALEWIEKQTAKYIICEIPVGGGKSHIAVTYAQYLVNGKQVTNGSYILTPQKILQKQYEDSFIDIKPPIMATLYGKGNYQCSSTGYTCDIGSIMTPKCQSCPYETAKTLAKIRPHLVLNYKLALILLGFTNVFKDPRKLMVFDECHNMENELTEFDAIYILKARCDKYKLPYEEFTNVEDTFKWIVDEYTIRLDEVLEDLMDRYELLLSDTSVRSADDIKKLHELQALTDHATTVSMLSTSVRIEDIAMDLVLIKERDGVKVKRLSAAHSFERVFAHNAERFLFMSSTILDHKQFCADLGIDPKETAFLSLDSEFPIENRPVFHIPIMKMNASWNSNDNIVGRTKMLDAIKLLLNDHHSDESGIIHTANFAIAAWLTAELKTHIPHAIFHHNPESGKDRGRVIEAFHIHNKPAVLISPSITEGLDLIDNLARFAIIVKVPFPFLGNEWINRKKELSQQWYLRQALIDIIQGSGRIVRSVDDWGTVYILDSNWSLLYNNAKKMMPAWWLNSYQEI